MTRPKTTEKSARIAVRADGSLRLAVVADTHSAPHPATTRHLGLLSPDAILHAGDVGELSVIDELEAIAPVFAVRGNIDVRAPGPPGRAHARRRRRWCVAATHPAHAHRGRRTEATRRRRAPRAVARGLARGLRPLARASHRSRPQSLGVQPRCRAGPRRFRLPILFGTIDVTPSVVPLAHFDCETRSALGAPRIRVVASAFAAEPLAPTPSRAPTSLFVRMATLFVCNGRSTRPWRVYLRISVRKREPNLQRAPSWRSIEASCPTCHGPMTLVVRSVQCPCDAPWCLTETKRFVCLDCGESYGAGSRGSS